MIQITNRTILYGLILFILTVAMAFLIHDANTLTGVLILVSWAILYSLITFVFLRSEDQAKVRGNLKFSYGLVAVIAVFPVIVIKDIIVSDGIQNALGDKVWVLPSIAAAIVINYLLQKRRLKGYRKEEVFK